MATITVQAADTSTAMEEIALKLGDDAMILSTTKKNGKVIMQASNDVPASSRKAAEPSPSTSDFDRLFASRLGQELASNTAIDLSGLTQNKAAAPAAPTSKMAAAEAPAPAPQTAQAPFSAEAQPHLLSAIALLAQKLEHIEDKLSAMTLTPYDGLNPELQASTPVQLRRAGFSESVITRLHASYAGLGYEAGVTSFLDNLGAELAIKSTHNMMNKRVYFIVGPSGSGRTTLAAKLAASLKDEHSGRVVALGHLASSSAETDNKLKSYARLLNLPFCHLTHDIPVQQFDKMTDFDIMVVDVTLTAEQANGYLSELKTALGEQDVQTIMSLQGGSSCSLITQSLNSYAALKPLIALTKLDECETTATEFSAFGEHDAQIALLSGTRSVVGALAFASGAVLSQYLKENFSSDAAA